MSFRRALWMIPAAIVVRNAEEYPKMVAYADRRGWEPGETQWRIALALATVIPASISTIAASRPENGLRLHLGLTIPSALPLNALDHARQTIQYGDYSPGTATGIGINLPLYVYGTAIREKWTTPGKLALAASAGPVVLGGMLYAFRGIGRSVSRWLEKKK